MITKMDVVTNKNINSQFVLRTGTGIFHEGMTLAEAKQIGRDKCFFKRDFSNIDKNCDNVLSADEILIERKKEVKRLRFDGLLASAFAGCNLVSVMKRFSLGNLIFGGLFAVFTIDSFSKMQKLKEANEQIEQNIHINA